MPQSKKEKAMWSHIKPFTKNNIKQIPNVEGIYMFYDENMDKLYVGVSDQRLYSGLKHRVESYAEKDDPKEHPTKTELRKKIAFFKIKKEPINQARQEEFELKQSMPFNADKLGEKTRK
jgi:excinuclease UvrABC nuclease subunit